MSDNEFTDWFDAHDNELLVMECEDIARTAFFAGMKAAQQSVQADGANLPPITVTKNPVVVRTG